MTDGLVSFLVDLKPRDITPSMSKDGKIAPMESNVPDDSANRDSLGTEDRDDRWHVIC